MAGKKAAQARPGRPEGPQSAVVRRLLEALLDQGPSKDKDLLHHVGLRDKRSLLRTARHLHDEGWVHLQETPAPRGERVDLVDRRLALGDRAGWTLALAATREALRCALVNPHGQLHYEWASDEMPFPPAEPMGPSSFAELLGEIVRGRLTALLGDQPGRVPELAGCVVSWPSRVGNDDEPVPFRARSGWEGTEVKPLIFNALSGALRATGFRSEPPRVALLNDADAEALGELRMGKATGAEVLLMVKLSGGVGASLVVSGELVRGANGFAGEIGHVPVSVEAAQLDHTPSARIPTLDAQEACYCGGTAHLQSYVNVEAILRRAGTVRRGSISRDQVREHLAAAQQLQTESPKVNSVLLQSGQLVGYVLRGPIMMFDPDLVLLRPAIGPRAARERIKTGVQMDLARALPVQNFALELGTPPEEGGDTMSLIGAAIYGVERFIRPRVLSRARGELPPDSSEDGRVR